MEAIERVTNLNYLFVSNAITLKQVKQLLTYERVDAGFLLIVYQRFNSANKEIYRLINSFDQGYKLLDSVDQVCMHVITKIKAGMHLVSKAT